MYNKAFLPFSSYKSIEKSLNLESLSRQGAAQIRNLFPPFSCSGGKLAGTSSHLYEEIYQTKWYLLWWDILVRTFYQK